MIEAVYDGFKEKEINLIKSKIKTGNFDKMKLIYFSLDNNSIIIEEKKYINEYAEKYLFMSDAGNVPKIYFTVEYIKKYILGGKKETKNDWTEISNIFRNFIEKLEEKQISFKYIDILKKIIDKFFEEKSYSYQHKNVDKTLKYTEMKEQFKTIIENNSERKSLYTIGYIKNDAKFLISEMKEYEEAIREIKFNNTEDSLIYGICDFCGKEKKLISNFGQSDPFKLSFLKMIGSTNLKGFYNNDKKNIKETIRCCCDCIYILKGGENLFEKNNLVCTLKPHKNSKFNVRVYFQAESISCNDNIDNSREQLKELVKGVFDISSFLKKAIQFDFMQQLNNFNFVVNVFFACKDKQKNQVINEFKNIPVFNLVKIQNKLEYVNKILRNMFNDNYRFDFGNIFEIIGKYNKRIAIDTLGNFLNLKQPDFKLLLKYSIKDIKRSLFVKKPNLADKEKNKEYFYLKNLTKNIAFIISFSKMLKVDGGVMSNQLSFEKVLKKITIKDKDKKEKDILVPKEINEIVPEIYIGISDFEIALMRLGEIIFDIKRRLNKKSADREKIFFKKLNFNGMNKKDIEKFILFIEQKIFQYSNDLKNVKGFLNEKLNEITITINNQEKIDKYNSVFRIVDGYNFKNRLQKIANIKNGENLEEEESEEF